MNRIDRINNIIEELVKTEFYPDDGFAQKTMIKNAKTYLEQTINLFSFQKKDLVIAYAVIYYAHLDLSVTRTKHNKKPKFYMDKIEKKQQAIQRTEQRLMKQKQQLTEICDAQKNNETPQKYQYISQSQLYELSGVTEPTFRKYVSTIDSILDKRKGIPGVLTRRSNYRKKSENNYIYAKIISEHYDDFMDTFEGRGYLEAKEYLNWLIENGLDPEKNTPLDKYGHVYEFLKRSPLRYIFEHRYPGTGVNWDETAHYMIKKIRKVATKAEDSE